MGLTDLLSSGADATKRALFGGAKTKAVIVLKQYWEADPNTSAIDDSGNISVSALSKTQKTGAISVEDAVTVAKQKGTAVASTSSLSSAASLASSVADTAKNAASAVASAVSTLTDNSNTSDAGSMKSGSTSTEANMQCKTVEYTVMFNPETLHLTARGGGYVLNYENAFGKAKDGEGDNETVKEITYVPNPHRAASLDMELIFDKVNGSDASSIIDPFSYNLTGGSLKNLVSSLGNKQYSVQRDVEGFLAALRNNRTTEATLRWGDMEYTGIITRVDAKYVMFNPKGYPIRAVVRFQMRLIDPSNTNDNIEMGKYFSKAYKKVLMDDKIQSAGYTSWNTTANKTGSLINLNL